MPENRANAVCKDSEIFDKLSRKCDKKDIIQKNQAFTLLLAKELVHLKAITNVTLPT